MLSVCPEAVDVIRTAAIVVKVAMVAVSW